MSHLVALLVGDQNTIIGVDFHGKIEDEIHNIASIANEFIFIVSFT